MGARSPSGAGRVASVCAQLVVVVGEAGPYWLTPISPGRASHRCVTSVAVTQRRHMSPDLPPKS